MHKFAILIPARNEEKVIGSLIDSLHAQTYPAEYIDIFVVADNCDDETAKIAKEKRATVYARKNNTEIGKGYALNYFLNKIKKNRPNHEYDAYIIFDADNLVNKNFISEIDKVYSDGYEIVSSYRNSKNFDDNWISATSGIYFLYHSRLFRRRFKHDVCCAVLGTGFLISQKVLNKYGGWRFFTLGEDAELSVRALNDGIKIGYANNAIVYDEQPTRFINFWNQRLRWVRGHLQVVHIYKSSPAITGIDPLAIATVAEFLSIVLALCIIVAAWANNFNPWSYLILVFSLAYIPNLAISISTVITERARIRSDKFKKILYAFSFPIMILIFIFAAVVALFSYNKRSWKIIQHNNKTIDQVEGDS